MSRYPITEDKLLVTSDKTIIWNDSQYTSLQYMDASDSTLTDTINESYATAIDENETQYLSVLETSDDITLNDLQNIIENQKSSSVENVILPEEDANADVDPDHNQVVVFTMEGSNDLYGLQLAQDEYGNLRKYQFKLGTTIDGHLEAIPDTIKLVDEHLVKEESQLFKHDETLQDQQTEEDFHLCQEDFQGSEIPDHRNDASILAVYIKGERHSPRPIETEEVFEDFDDKTQVDNENNKANNMFEETINIKTEKLEEHLENVESQELRCNNLIVDTENNSSMQYVSVELQDIENAYEIEQFSENSSENVENIIENEEQEEFVDSDHYEEIYIQENRIHTAKEQTTYNADTGQLADTEDEIAATCTAPAPDFILHEVTEKPSALEKTNILKRSSVCPIKDNKTKKSSDTVYYVVYPDKENVNLSSDVNNQTLLQKLPKTNPRSILKSSFVKSADPKIQTVITNTVPSVDERFQKRFAKSKEAVEAKRFHNFINKTTIPQAPVRANRLPRKQKIKPVQRRDEEIIVQEVMLSSNGIIESIEDKLKNMDRLEVTAVVELTDSEDECHKPNINEEHVLNSDSDSEASVIEVGVVEDSKCKRLDDIPEESTVTENSISKTKKLRNQVESSIVNQHIRDKRNRGSGAIANIVKKEIACPKCPKSFPSQNSLNTHIQHHNLENNLKRNLKMQSYMTRQSVAPTEYKYKCDDCQQTFKNTILLKKHSCLKKESTYKCGICLKQFRDVSLLNIHKRSHAKSNLVKTTSVEVISPKKKRLTMSNRQAQLTCKECGKVCGSESILKVHEKTHQKFLCSCPASFSSRILFDTHRRTNCVKMNSPANKRLSFKTKKSFVNTPPRIASSSKIRNSMCNSTLNKSVSGLPLECDKCKMTFSLYRNLYTHKVQQHGLDTPDKSLLAPPKPSVYKARSAHGGIPTNDRMKKAYAALRKKLAENQEPGNV